MPKFSIRCPFHGIDEEITLPDGYFGHGQDTFTGDIPCGGAVFGNQAMPQKPILTVELFMHTSGNVKIRSLVLKSPVQ